LDNNSLQINYDKSSFLYFKINSNHNTELNTYYIIHDNSSTFDHSICCCSSIKKACSVEYLGLYLDDPLKWNLHINKLINNLRKFLNLKSILSDKLKIMIYKVLVQSIIS